MKTAPAPPALQILPLRFPEVGVGASEVVILTRCPDFGQVLLEVWAGDQGPASPEHRVVFDGSLQSNGNGFDFGGLASVFHLKTAPGKYRVRAETRRDASGYVDAVAFVFPESSNLTGEALF